MFPDRVGRVLLDGVVNPITWTNGTDSDKTTAAFRDVEMVLDLFTQYCADVRRRGLCVVSCADCNRLERVAVHWPVRQMAAKN